MRDAIFKMLLVMFILEIATSTSKADFNDNRGTSWNADNRLDPTEEELKLRREKFANQRSFMQRCHANTIGITFGIGALFMPDPYTRALFQGISLGVTFAGEGRCYCKETYSWGWDEIEKRSIREYNQECVESGGHICSLGPICCWTPGSKNPCY